MNVIIISFVSTQNTFDLVFSSVLFRLYFECQAINKYIYIINTPSWKWVNRFAASWSALWEFSRNYCSALKASLELFTENTSTSLSSLTYNERAARFTYRFHPEKSFIIRTLHSTASVNHFIIMCVIYFCIREDENHQMPNYYHFIIFYSHKEEQTGFFTYIYVDCSWSHHLLVSIIVFEAHGLLCVF